MSDDEGGGWVERYVGLVLTELGGGELSAEERRYVAGVELVARVLPGALEEALLVYALKGEVEDG